MSVRTWLIGLVVCSLAAAAGAQSLAEIANKEKERRKKNKEKGSQVHVITAEELAKAKAPVFSSTAIASGARQGETEATGGQTASGEQEESASETEAPTSIPADASMTEKIAAFQAMVQAYKAQVQKMDEQIAKNNARLAEIEQELNTINASGLPTAPQADRTQHYPGEAVALQQEQQQLRQKNLELERQKKALADDLREKGRRAGLPASYLRF